MRKKFNVYPRKITGSSKRVKDTRIVANHDFYYETYGPESDPADWEIDYDEFFEAIEANIEELGLEVVDYNDERTMGGRICTFELSNGSSLDSYDLETDILYALDDREIRGSQTDKFIQDYIKRCCMS